MKKFITLLIIVLTFNLLYAQNNDTIQETKKGKKEKIYNEKGEIIKKGWNFGPLPVVGFNSDLGFQYGACVDIFNYGDGSNYPKYDYKMNVELSTYTRGSSIMRFYGDFKNLIPKSKVFVDLAYFIDKKFDFYGFNGYNAPYFKHLAVFTNDEETAFNIDNQENVKSAFNFMRRNQVRALASLQHPLGNVKNLYYGVGLAYFNYNMNRINISDYDDQITLYELYCQSGIIREDEKNGGNITQAKLGLIYDSRNHDNDPTHGLYIEGSFAVAPDLIDGRKYDHLTFTGVLQQYIPIYKDRLTFAYRLAAQNVIAGDIPYYAMFNTNLLFYKKMTTDALGGSNSVRGINRNGVIGKGVSWLNVELRWRFFDFQLINQNWMLGINPFFDAGMVTQDFRLDEQEKAWDIIKEHYNLDNETENLIYSGKDEGIHSSAGCGLKIIMNHNLVVSVECAKALDARDGGKMKAYVGFNYIF